MIGRGNCSGNDGDAIAVHLLGMVASVRRVFLGDDGIVMRSEVAQSEIAIAADIGLSQARDPERVEASKARDGIEKKRGLRHTGERKGGQRGSPSWILQFVSEGCDF